LIFSTIQGRNLHPDTLRDTLRGTFRDTLRDTERGGSMARTEDRAREVRLRRKATNQGLELHKSRRRDVDALDYGTYTLRSTDGLEVATSQSLDDVEEYLTRKH
jgi:hypothetical protein